MPAALAGHDALQQAIMATLAVLSSRQLVII
jgi:hypothetical protein